MIRKTKLAKIAAVAAGFSMALTSAMPVGAVTIAELQAQIAALMAQLNALQGGTTTTVSVSFTRDLTIGSSGAEVTALQQTLVAQGYLTMPAGVAYGYFGSLTKSAVARWQAAVGLPATGFFGPMSRAKLNAVGGTTTGGSTTGGTTTGGATGTISTPGMEGDISVTSAPVSDVTLDEGQSMAPVLAFQVKAVGASDMAVQRVQLNLGNSTSIYNKILSRIYLVDDAGKTLASVDLNSTNVYKDGSSYFVNLVGFSSVVAKNSTRTYTVKGDVRGSIETADQSVSRTITLPINGVRAVDGAGIDSYAPSSALTNSFTISNSPIDSASLTVSTDINTPATRQIVANGGTDDNEADKVTLVSFNAKAEKDSVKITEVPATITVTGSNQASTTVYYLYAGSQLLDTVANTDSDGSISITFDDLSYTVAKDATANFSIATDIRNANANATVISAAVTGSAIVAENSLGDSVTPSGSASGNAVTVINAGPEVTLLSKTISKSSTDAGTTTAQATFKVKLAAVGSDIYFDDDGADAFDFAVYTTSGTTTVTAVNMTVPSTGVGTVTDGFYVQEGNSAEVTVDVLYTVGPNTTPSTYSVGLDRVNWGTSQATRAANELNYMLGKTEWRTSSVVLP